MDCGGLKATVRMIVKVAVWERCIKKGRRNMVVCGGPEAHGMNINRLINIYRAVGAAAYPVGLNYRTGIACGVHGHGIKSGP